MQLSNNTIKHELWRRGNLQWKLHSAQLTVYNNLRALPSSVREPVVFISRRWGKSYLGVDMALEDCLQNDGVQVFIVGPDLKQTRKIVTPLINQICADAPEGLIKHTKSELMWRVGNSTLHIGAFDTALESFRGLEAYSIYLEESGLSNPEEYDYTIKSVLRPTLMHSRGSITHLTTPSKFINHPLHTETIPRAQSHNAFFKYTIHDNPLLSKEAIEEEIEASGGMDSEHTRRELFCEIVKDVTRLITPEFDYNKHVKDLIIPDYAYFITALDFGGVKDNHAILLGYYDFERKKRCYVDEVWLDINTSTEDIVKMAIELEERNNVKWLYEGGTKYRVVDAPGQLHVDLRRMGFQCRLPGKGRDSVEDGIQAIRVALLRNEIEISPKCSKLIATLQHGTWDKQRKDFSRTVELGHCDMLAALSYSFRHMHIHNNPTPPNLNLHHDKHFYSPKEHNEDLSALDSVFYGD